MSALLIVPAAGAGRRLGGSVPKVLAPVAGRAMIDYLLDLYNPVVDRFVVVLHPSAVAAVQRHCGDRPWAIEYVTQAEPTGMLDALLEPSARVAHHAPDRVWITWCDQVAVRRATVRRLAAFARDEPGADLILPTAEQVNPYIHLVRDATGRIVDVLHRREGDDLPPVGESDAGLFCLSRQAYQEYLPRFARVGATGAATRERNFLPFLPWLAERAVVRSFPCGDPSEALGVNTPDDRRRVEAYLEGCRARPGTDR